jgi:hypothetical protein
VTITLIARPAARKRTYAPSGAVGLHLTRAARLQAQIQELQAQYDTERAWLQAHMSTRALTQVELGSIRAVLKARARWTYSPQTQREMQALSVTQKWEQSRGIATNEPSFYVALTTSEK